MQKLIKSKIQENSLNRSDIQALDYLDQDAKTCPVCGESFVGQEIPKEYLHYYGGKTHYSRMIGVEIPNLYDGIILWKCRDCGNYFRRF